jgi:hypothetical protein
MCDRFQENVLYMNSLNQLHEVHSRQEDLGTKLTGLTSVALQVIQKLVSMKMQLLILSFVLLALTCSTESKKN